MQSRLSLHPLVAVHLLGHLEFEACTLPPLRIPIGYVYVTLLERGLEDFFEHERVVSDDARRMGVGDRRDLIALLADPFPCQLC